MEAAASVGREPPTKNGPHRSDRRIVSVYILYRDRDIVDLQEKTTKGCEIESADIFPRTTSRIYETAITNVWNRKRSEVQGTRMRTILHAYCDFRIEYLGE